MAVSKNDDAQRRINEIYGRVLGGFLEPKAAEQIAIEEGLGPLRPEPAAHEFDPEQEAWWSLAMVVAWIAWRTIDRVRQQYDHYRFAAPYWAYVSFEDIVGLDESYPKGGYSLRDQSPASAAELPLAEACDRIIKGNRYFAITTVAEAKDDLWRKASLGNLRAAAVQLTDREVIEIPKHHWPYLVLQQEHLQDVLRFRHAKSARYRLVMFEQSEVRRIWPAGAISAMAKRDAYDRCEAWFDQLVSASPGLPTLTATAARLYAQKSFGISRDGFRIIRAEVIERHSAHAWNRAGRRKDAEKIRRRK